MIGGFLTNLQAMADHLRRHWSAVFRARGVDNARLQQWLDDDAEARSRDGPSHDVVAGMRLRKRHIRQALKLSNKSSPGPDGIPYGGWRALSEFAVDILYGAFAELILPDGPEILRRDCPDFNASLLFSCQRSLQSMLPMTCLHLKHPGCVP